MVHLFNVSFISHRNSLQCNPSQRTQLIRTPAHNVSVLFVPTKAHIFLKLSRGGHRFIWTTDYLPALSVVLCTIENFLFLKTFPGCWACSQFVYLNSNKKEAAGKKNSLNSILSNYCLSKHTNFIDLIVTLIQRRSS